MNQEEILKNAYLTRGAIEIFRIMQEDMFEGIAIATPESLCHSTKPGIVEINTEKYK